MLSSLVAGGVLDTLIRVLVSIISASLTGYRGKDVLVCICLIHKAVLNEAQVCIFGIKHDHCKYTFLRFYLAKQLVGIVSY